MASASGEGIEKILEQAVAQVEKQAKKKDGETKARRADAWADVFANKSNKNNRSNENEGSKEEEKEESAGTSLRKRDREGEGEGEPSKSSRTKAATKSVTAKGDGDGDGSGVGVGVDVGGSGKKKKGKQNQKKQSGLIGDPVHAKAAPQQQTNFSGGDLQDRTKPVCSRRDYVTAYTVEVGKFGRDYRELKGKLSDELERGARAMAAAKDLKSCDISLLESLLFSPSQENNDRTKSTAVGKDEEHVAKAAELNQTQTQTQTQTERDLEMEKEKEKETGRGREGERGRLDLMEAVQPDETILSIGVFHPAKPTRKMQEIIVLGSQKLTVLKDKVVCQRDEIAKNRGLKVPSSFFFINGCFYNDMRDKDAIQYSDEVMQFIKHKQSQKHYKYGNSGNQIKKEGDHQNDYQFSTRRMEDVSFNELDLKLGGGCPYVYCHQGCCEHRLAFLDLRLAHPKLDRKPVSDYPYVVYQKFERRHRCMVCGIYEGKFVTYEDIKATCSPCIFCDECYHFLHTGQDGKPLYECKVFEYPSGVPKET